MHVKREPVVSHLDIFGEIGSAQVERSILVLIDMGGSCSTPLPLIVQHRKGVNHARYRRKPSSHFQILCSGTIRMGNSCKGDFVRLADGCGAIAAARIKYYSIGASRSLGWRPCVSFPRSWRANYAR